MVLDVGLCDDEIEFEFYPDGFANVDREINEFIRSFDRLAYATPWKAIQALIEVRQTTGGSVPFCPARVPYWEDVSVALASTEHRGAIFIGPPQDAGKTVFLVALATAWYIATLKVNATIWANTQEMSHTLSNGKVNEIIGDSPILRDQMDMSPQGQGVYVKKAKAGNRLGVKWASESNLTSVSLTFGGITDYDRLPLSINGRGSPFSLAANRMRSAGSLGSLFVESSIGRDVADKSAYEIQNRYTHALPSVDGIGALYNETDRRRCYTRCLACDFAFEPVFDLIKPTAQYLRGESDPQVAAQTVALHCPKCSTAMPYRDKKRLIKRAQWVGEGQKINDQGVLVGSLAGAEYAGFLIQTALSNGGVSPWSTRWLEHENAFIQRELTGNEQALRQVYESIRNEPYPPLILEQVSIRTIDDIKDNAVEMAEKLVPWNTVCLIATVDVQQDSFQVLVTAVGPQQQMYPFARYGVNEARVRAYAKEKGHDVFDENGRAIFPPEGWKPEVRVKQNPAAYIEDAFDMVQQVMLRTWMLPTEDGYREMAVAFTGLDFGGAAGWSSNATELWRLLKKNYRGLEKRLALMQGLSTKGKRQNIITQAFPTSERKPGEKLGKATRGDVPIWQTLPDAFKDMIDGMLNRKDPGPNRIYIPKHFADNARIMNEMTSEQGQADGSWKQIKKRNETWDLLYMCRALMQAQSLTGMLNENWANPKKGHNKPWHDGERKRLEGNNLVFEVDEEAPMRGHPFAVYLGLIEKQSVGDAYAEMLNDD